MEFIFVPNEEISDELSDKNNKKVSIFDIKFSVENDASTKRILLNFLPQCVAQLKYLLSHKHLFIIEIEEDWNTKHTSKIAAQALNKNPKPSSSTTSSYFGDKNHKKIIGALLTTVVSLVSES